MKKKNDEKNVVVAIKRKKGVGPAILKTETVEINFTEEFEYFFDSPFNREISNSHVKHLVKSFKENGYHSMTPLICDQNFVLLDGHHKREALRLYYEQTGIRLAFTYRIKFCASDEERLKEMQIHNAYKKDWTMKQVMRISNTSYARYIKALYKKYDVKPFNFKGKRKPMYLSDYLDPASVNYSLRLGMNKSDMVSKKDICDQDQLDIAKLFEVVFFTLSTFTKTPPLKRLFVNNCGHIVHYMDGKTVNLGSWRTYILNNFTEDQINSEKFVSEVFKIFRKFCNEN